MADITRSLDHLIGNDEQQRRNDKAERGYYSEVDI
jgi:hypothetical protein